MSATYTRDGDMVTVTFSPGRDVTFHLVDRAMVERSTGTLRKPELTVDLDRELIATLTEQPAQGGPVVGILVHTMSRRSTAVGEFPSAKAATTWWGQPFNRLATGGDMLFILAAPAREVSW